MISVLNIETASPLCSVCLSLNGDDAGYLESSQPNAHSSLLAGMINEILSQPHPPLSAVAVSIGPGSYTGLRIGLSTAKGMAYRLGIPLIAVPTLKIIASGYLCQQPATDSKSILCPMTDARRNEVYMAQYNVRLSETLAPRPLILDSPEVKNCFTDSHYIIMGSGSPKAMHFLSGSNYIFDIENYLSARYMKDVSFSMAQNNDFADIVLQSPLYLKEFEAIKPKINVIYKGTQFDKPE
jgi:tRNA threonylcarbamoyladenosine biosynthesis protein TsaB